MSESYHTSRMRETCTSGSQEGRGSDGHWPSAFQSVLLAYSTLILKDLQKITKVTKKKSDVEGFLATPRRAGPCAFAPGVQRGSRLSLDQPLAALIGLDWRREIPIQENPGPFCFDWV